MGKVKAEFTQEQFMHWITGLFAQTDTPPTFINARTGKVYHSLDAYIEDWKKLPKLKPRGLFKIIDEA